MEDILEAYSRLDSIVSKMDDSGFDHVFWKNLISKEDFEEFDKHIEIIEESQNWDRKLNWKKGGVLEDFAVFLFNRFQDVQVEKNKRPGDNETDIETQMGEKPKPLFIKQVIGQNIICECKNKKTSSVDVGMVSKLAEILPNRDCKFGIFISILGIGGYGWRYGEGKRKKIMYKERLPIISFTVDELKGLRNGRNFYTMIKNKYRALLDEVDDDSADIPDVDHREYRKRINEFVEHLKKTSLLNEQDYKNVRSRIIEKYGEGIDE
jgi:hypothetical protein